MNHVAARRSIARTLAVVGNDIGGPSIDVVGQNVLTNNSDTPWIIKDIIISCVKTGRANATALNLMLGSGGKYDNLFTTSIIVDEDIGLGNIIALEKGEQYVVTPTGTMKQNLATLLRYDSRTRVALNPGEWLSLRSYSATTGQPWLSIVVKYAPIRGTTNVEERPATSARGTGSAVTTFPAVAPIPAKLQVVAVAVTGAVTPVVRTMYICDATAGAIILTIPAADATNGGLEVIVKKIDASVNTVTVSSASNIDGGSVVLATQYEGTLAVSDETTWHEA